MKSFLLFVFTISLFFITKINAQDITATLGGNTSAEGFSVVNALSDTVFRITGEGNVGIYPSIYQQTPHPNNIFEVQGGSSSNQNGRGITLISESTLLNGGSITIRGGNGDNYGRGGGVNITGGSSNTGSGYGGGITLSGGIGSVTGNISINTGTDGAYNNNTGSISLTTASNSENSAGGINISTGNSQNGTTNTININSGSNGNGGGDIVLEVESTNAYAGSGHISLTPHSGGGLVIINGSGTYSGSWTMASDERYKKNIEPLKNSVVKLEQLNGVSYELKKEEFPEKNFVDGRQLGLIAQEVEKVFPELIKTDDAGFKSIAYQNMVAVLVEAIKEQQKSIDQLKKEVEQLKSSAGNNNVDVSSLENEERLKWKK